MENLNGKLRALIRDEISAVLTAMFGPVAVPTPVAVSKASASKKLLTAQKQAVERARKDAAAQYQREYRARKKAEAAKKGAK